MQSAFHGGSFTAGRKMTKKPGETGCRNEVLRNENHHRSRSGEVELGEIYQIAAEW
jgi:hypothetical protein